MNIGYQCNDKQSSRQPYKLVRTLLKRFIKRVLKILKTKYNDVFYFSALIFEFGNDA